MITNTKNILTYRQDHLPALVQMERGTRTACTPRESVFADVHSAKTYSLDAMLAVPAGCPHTLAEIASIAYVHSENADRPTGAMRQSNARYGAYARWAPAPYVFMEDSSYEN